MGPAIIGLIGVFIGALLSGTATFIMARRAEARQARAAARLLETELRTVAGDLYQLTTALKYPDDYADWRTMLRLPPQRAWDAHKALLATVLTSPEWYAVATAYESLDALRAAGSLSDLFVDEGRRISHADIRDLFIDLVDQVQAGASAVSGLLATRSHSRSRQRSEMRS